MGGNLNFIAVLGTFWFKNYIPPSNGRRGWGGDPPSNVQEGGEGGNVWSLALEF